MDCNVDINVQYIVGVFAPGEQTSWKCFLTICLLLLHLTLVCVCVCALLISVTKGASESLMRGCEGYTY